MALKYILSFEKPVAELETKLEELRAFSESHDIDLTHELQEMERKIRETRRRVFENLTPWDEVQLARHPQRPPRGGFDPGDARLHRRQRRIRRLCEGRGRSRTQDLAGCG